MNCKECITYAICRSELISEIEQQLSRISLRALEKAAKNTLECKCSIFRDYVQKRTENENEHFMFMYTMYNILQKHFDITEVIGEL